MCFLWLLSFSSLHFCTVFGSSETGLALALALLALWPTLAALFAALEALLARWVLLATLLHTLLALLVGAHNAGECLHTLLALLLALLAFARRGALDTAGTAVLGALLALLVLLGEPLRALGTLRVGLAT